MSSDVISALSKLQPPKLSQAVHREECTQCFDNQDTLLGVDVCLVCFNGGCLDSERHHARDHSQKTGHRFSLNVRRKLKPQTDSAEPPAKKTKLAIVEERESDKYEFETAVKDWSADVQNGAVIPDATNHTAVKGLVDGVLLSMSSARQSEVKSWEEEIVPCEHTLTLEQDIAQPTPASGLAHCSKCDLRENLWLCLTCGSLGCGRQQYGGLGGNGHGLAHYEETRHPVSVKLGTITPEGDADVYCYSCNDGKQDPDVALHLANFGINIQTQTKTEKSMTELQIEQNLKYDFSMTDESGNALEPLFGPGLTGLANLGNSCYIASVVQVTFTLPSFQERYYATTKQHWATCSERLPATCLDCQMHKLADGLLSGRYSVPRTQDENTPSDPLQHSALTKTFQTGVRPVTFKALVGKGHEEFATMRQQDAEEFFSYFLSIIRREAHKTGRPDPTRSFSFEIEQRLQCTKCGRVRYRNDEQDVLTVPVPARVTGTDGDGKTLYEQVALTECLDIATGAEELPYKCPQCQADVLATKRSKFATFPQTLVLHAKKFQLVNWVPSKLDIPIAFPEDDIFTLDSYLGQGLQAGESALPEDAPSEPEFNQEALQQLEAMGFPTVRCKKALHATGNSDPQAAMEWLFTHMEDPDIDSPVQTGAANVPQDASPETIALLASMGFTELHAKNALRETGGDPERAIEWLFSHPDGGDQLAASDTSQSKERAGSTHLPASYQLRAFVSHKGPSVHSGHYVAHIKKGNEWVLFNDEKVVKVDPESLTRAKSLAYLYFFARV